MERIELNLGYFLQYRLCSVVIQAHYDLEQLEAHTRTH